MERRGEEDKEVYKAYRGGEKRSDGGRRRMEEERIHIDLIDWKLEAERTPEGRTK